ncbi:unnamed protein product [Lactuca virosa]|uniref:Uncharacterized protein n=1 Tax=Lactuca virosa TaxID=75947 RepID=A0AAU9PVV6_9ASTR|nr:unnamed protein product [Lactuca virosa]
MKKFQASKGIVVGTQQPNNQIVQIDSGKRKWKMISNKDLKQRKRYHVGRMIQTANIIRHRQSKGEDIQKKGNVKKFWNFETIKSLAFCDVREF